jgi:ABC-type nitrate/sulfonate/bicarbonate transport system ATPase subunit
MTPEPAVELRGVSVTYRGASGLVHALSNVDLSVPPGEFLVVIGPSGQGKSTLLSTVAGLLTPSAGEVLAGGKRVSGPGRDRGMVFQDDTVLPWMRVRDNVAWGLQLRGMGTTERRRLADHYLDEVGLAHVANAWPKELSGGMRKRVSLATAFAADPDVLLMDEPFGSLDFVTRTALHSIVIRLWSEDRKTVVFVTHDVDEALLLADRIVVVRDGGIAQDVRLEFSRPRTDELRADPEAIALRRALLAQLGVHQDDVLA